MVIMSTILILSIIVIMLRCPGRVGRQVHRRDALRARAAVRSDGVTYSVACVVNRVWYIAYGVGMLCMMIWYYYVDWVQHLAYAPGAATRLVQYMYNTYIYIYIYRERD